MAYIHRGGYDTGSANNVLYNGVNLCRRGAVVVVTISHRLNLFGFLYLVDLAAGFENSGNAGMLDLVLALQWVRNTSRSSAATPAAWPTIRAGTNGV